jgi:hypothetical protein
MLTKNRDNYLLAYLSSNILENEQGIIIIFDH